ncbi:hypothetical protein QVD17_12185 [Tagetes erecta]|uniref:MCM C-terminal AAA(+) ATPase domain-containing protein n=1 Tax=Tagetes erecta TaxID=13708 RepID=A0AAD8L1Y8_TARER|nr:hypothetical protein QVD17_12185 [Tagetes erecta]
MGLTRYLFEVFAVNTPVRHTFLRFIQDEGVGRRAYVQLINLIRWTSQIGQLYMKVIEQQTVNIAKARITTSLNARTAVLVVANHTCAKDGLFLSKVEACVNSVILVGYYCGRYAIYFLKVVEQGGRGLLMYVYCSICLLMFVDGYKYR